MLPRTVIEYHRICVRRGSGRHALTARRIWPSLDSRMPSSNARRSSPYKPQPRLVSFFLSASLLSLFSFNRDIFNRLSESDKCVAKKGTCRQFGTDYDTRWLRKSRNVKESKAYEYYIYFFDSDISTFLQSPMIPLSLSLSCTIVNLLFLFIFIYYSDCICALYYDLCDFHFSVLHFYNYSQFC